MGGRYLGNLRGAEGALGSSREPLEPEKGLVKLLLLPLRNHV